MDEDDLVRHWIDSGLIAGTEDYEGAYIRGLKQDAANYKAGVEAQYQEFKNGPRERSLRQQFTKPGSTETYASVAEYLAQDKTYQALPESSRKAYADAVTDQFNQFMADDAIQKKFTRADGTRYVSAREYLENDAAYQQLVKNTQEKTNPYVREVNKKYTAFKNGDDTYRAMFTKEDGTTYDTVQQYLLADATYQGYIKDQNDYEGAVFDEFSHFVHNKSKGLLADMFTMPNGKTYDSAAAYLRDDATYNAMVKRYEHPEYAWTKEQLLYAIRNAIVNKESGVSSETQLKKANVQGGNVTLVARGIGVNSKQTTEIRASEIGGGSEAAIANLKKLANADAADVTLKDAKGNILVFTTGKETLPDGRVVEKQVVKGYDADNPILEVETDGIIDKFVIGNLSPLGVYATGRLDVTATNGSVFIAGRSNDQAGFSSVNVGQITAIGEDVRLYTREGINNAAVTASEMKQGNIHGHNLIAYGGTKDIGAQNKPLGVTLSGDLLEAYADGSIYIKNMTGTDRLRVGSLFAKNLISLESKPGFDMTTNPKYTLAYLNAGNVLELKTDENEGIVGREENPIRILNNGTLVNLKAKEGYVKGMNGLLGDNSTMTAVSESNLEAGATQLEEKDAQGNVIKPSITGEIHSGGNVKLEAAKDAVVSGPVLSTNGDILIKAAADASINEAVTATAGNVAVDAANLAKIKGSLEVKGAGKKVSVSGVKGIVLDGSVTAGLPYRNSDGSYMGGELIELISAEGTIVQNKGGGLTARRVTATSGGAVTLTNSNNKFREFTAYGVNTQKTNEQGETVTVKAIDGSVTVSAHAGNDLKAGIESTTVYGNVMFANLDDGNLVVDTDIVTKAGKNGEAGDITLVQDKGDVYALRSLQADGSVVAMSSLGAVINTGNITAGKNIDVGGTLAYDAIGLTMKAGGHISVATVRGG